METCIYIYNVVSKLPERIFIADCNCRKGQNPFVSKLHINRFRIAKKCWNTCNCDLHHPCCTRSNDNEPNYPTNKREMTQYTSVNIYLYIYMYHYQRYIRCCYAVPLLSDNPLILTTSSGITFVSFQRFPRYFHVVLLVLLSTSFMATFQIASRRLLFFLITWLRKLVIIEY